MFDVALRLPAPLIAFEENRVRRFAMSTKAKTISTDVITIKQVPHELKMFWNTHAKMNSRSMNKEIIRVLEEERLRLLGTAAAAKDKKRIHEIVQAMHSIPTIDDRPMDEILYDKNGMPK